jgi:tetratricopeptide (TPR) repeat protein
MIGLTQSDVADLVRLDTTVTGDDVDSVATELHKRTDGNPFFVTELVRLLTSERTLEVADRTNDIPLVVSDVIRRRLRRLPDNVHGVLGVAAVIGREFDLDVLHVAAGLAVDDAFEVLEAAVMARVVIETQPGLYRFSHGLVRETLFSDLTPGRRARLHAKVGEAIEAIYADDLGRHVSQLARHFAAADRWVAAVRYSELAAEQAESSFAYDEAVAHWRVAIEHAADDAHADIARLLIRLGAAHRGAGDAVTSADMHDLALEAAEASGDLALLAEAALAYGEVGLWQVRPYGTVDQRVVAAISTVLESQGIEDSPVRARLLAGLAIALYYQESERERGRQLVREAAALARRIGDRDLLGAILAELLVMLEGQPDTSEQLTIAGELDMVVGPDTPFETVATASMRLARIRLAAGDAQDLEREIAELSVRAAEQRHAVIMLWVMWARTGVAFVRGRLDEAERLAGEARERHEQLGIWGASETYATHMTYVWREQDRMEEVGPVVEPLLEEAAHPGSHKLLALYRLERGAKSEIAALIDRHLIPASHDFTWLPEMCLTAELCAGGDVDGAADLYAELLPFGGLVATMDGPYICMGAVSYYLGLLADTMSRHADAIAHLEHAVALNDQVGAVPWSARSRYHLARVLGGDDPDRVDRLVTEGLDIADTHNLPAIRRQFRGLHAVH